MTEPARLCQSVRMDALRGRWRAECTAVAPTADTAAVDAVGTDLLQRWREPHRRYHDLTHLGEVLTAVDALCAAEGVDRADHAAASLAAWFHDAVHEGHEDDEERSAAWAEDALQGRPDVAEVARLVRLTVHHKPAADDLAGQVLCDADLAVLAAGPEPYAAYVDGVRQEYAHVPDDAFATGRAAVLRDLLRGPLFHTSRGRERWERAARANVEAELTELDQVYKQNG